MQKRYLTVFFLLHASLIRAQFYTLETEEMRIIYYGKAYAYLVPHVARCTQNALQFHKNLFNYRPSEKITVLLHDFSDYGDAGADALPKNHVSIAIAPYNYVYETVPANERMNSTLNHEIVHIAANDRAASADRFFRTIFFGKVSTTSEQPLSILYSNLTNPRRYAPRWYHEGIAVFMETWMAGGLGRALGAYDEMVFRTIALDKGMLYDRVGLESEGTKVDFQVGVNSYLYGTRFMSYLAYQYGPDLLIQWVTRSINSSAYFASEFKNVYHRSLDDAWMQWIEWERRFQSSNLDSIRQNPVTPYRAVSDKALGSVSRAFHDSSRNYFYVGVNYPGHVAHLAMLKANHHAITHLLDIKGAVLYSVSSVAYDDSKKILFYTTDNNDWRDLNTYDLKTNSSRLLLKDARVGDLAYNRTDRSIWGIRHYNGISTLVRIPYPYSEWNQIYSWPYGKDMYDLDISHDGKNLSGALAEISGRQTLIMMNIEKLLNNDTSYETLFDFENSIPSNFVFSADGKYLYGASYFTGVSNIFRYDIPAKQMDAVTNAETGFFRPIPVGGDSLMVFKYTSKGFVPVLISNKPVENVSAINFLGQKIVEKYPSVRQWNLDSPAKIPIDSLTTYSGSYSAAKHFGLASAYPVAEGYKNFQAYGMRMNFSDPMGLYTLDVTTSYTPDAQLAKNERWHVAANFTHLNWKVNFDYNGADFYDLFGPTKTSRKGYALGINYNKSLLYDEPKTSDLHVGITGYGGLERLPDYQNIGTTYDRFIASSIAYNYKYLRSSLGAVDHEKGHKWQIVSGNTYVNGKVFPKLHNNLDLGIPLPIDHSSVWLRSSIGKAFGARSNPFANFYFGGFGNNWVDHTSETQYREYYSFPGVRLNEIGGNNFAKLLTEWVLPPLRFRHVGFPSFYATWTRLEIFTSGITTNIDNKIYKRSLYNIGAQLDLRIMMMSYLKLTLSVGYARAYEKHQSVSREWMISLKIL